MNNIFAFLIELLFYNGNGFSDAVFDNGLYASSAIVLLVSTILLVILFYYIINSPKFNKWFHWILILFVNFVVNLLFPFLMIKSKLTDLGYVFSGEYLTYSLINAAYATLLFIILSFAIRWGSSNCRQTPFPN